MSLSNQNPFSPEKINRRTKRKIKYLIIASSCGTIYGAFNPDEEVKAITYSKELSIKEPSSLVQLYKVSNLNQFLSNLKYEKRKARKITQEVIDTKCEYKLVSKPNESSSS